VHFVRCTSPTARRPSGRVAWLTSQPEGDAGQAVRNRFAGDRMNVSLAVRARNLKKMVRAMGTKCAEAKGVLSW